MNYFTCQVGSIKGYFFQKVWCIFLIDLKLCRKLSVKRDLEIAFCLESANCSVWGRENSKYEAYDRTQHIFWAMEIMPIFFQEYRTFSNFTDSQDSQEFPEMFWFQGIF